MCAFHYDALDHPEAVGPSSHTSRTGGAYDAVFSAYGRAGILRKHTSPWPVAALAVCLPQLAAAGLRERLLEFDLNDFAIGAGLATTESVYVGGKNSVTIYPAIASLFPGAFDDDLAGT